MTEPFTTQASTTQPSTTEASTTQPSTTEPSTTQAFMNQSATIELGFDVAGPDRAPALLLGPSLGSTRAMWQATRDALSDRYRVISFDLLGHGTSAVPAGPYTLEQLGRSVLALLDHLDVGAANYAGVSLGGMVGMWLAINEPDRIDRLALICTAPILPPAQGWLDRAEQVRAHGTASIADAVVARWFTDPFRAGSPEVVAQYRAMIADTDDQGYASCCGVLAELDLRTSLPAIQARTLVVSGRDDLAAPPPHGAAIAAAVPSARMVVLDGAAHLANVERASDVNALVSDLLEGR